MDGCDIDLWEMYRDYINGTKEINPIRNFLGDGNEEKKNKGKRIIVDEG